MTAVRLDPYQNIVGVGWGGQRVGLIEIVRFPPISAPDPLGYLNGYAQMMVPDRGQRLWSNGFNEFHSDPDVGGPFANGGSQFGVPPQASFDEIIMIAPGDFQYNDPQVGGSANFMINWNNLRKPETWGLDAVPTEGFEPLQVDLFGQWNDAFSSGSSFPTVTVELRFRLLATGDMSVFTMESPWYLVEFEEGTGGVIVLAEAEPVTRTFNAASFGAHPDDAQYLATLFFDFQQTSEPKAWFE